MARLLISVGLAAALTGCSGSIQIPPQPTIVEAPVEKPQAVCLVRARLFHGLVGVPCSNLAQEFKP